MNKPASMHGGNKLSRRRRAMLLGTAFILVASMVLPLFGYLYASFYPAEAAAENPRANYWRAVREGNTGYSSVTGVRMDGVPINPETTVLVQNGGQNWRQLRNGPVTTYGGWALAAMAGLLVLYFLYRGQVKIAGGRSGQTVPRWNLFERTVHWFTAILFVVLMITGLSMQFGRAVLIPVLGLQGFSVWAQFSLSLHNYLGPLFVVGVAVMLVVGLIHNLPTKEDLQWLKSVGGMFDRSGKSHPPSWKVNAGEKVVYWVMATIGVVVCVTGVILDFPNLGQTRDDMQISQLIHSIAAAVWMVVMLGHIYLGSIGVEGAWEGMTTGRVDANRAKQHHNLWHDEVTRGATTASGGPAPAGAVSDKLS